MVLEVSGLAHRYGRHLALDGFDLLVPERRIVLLLGLNGAGKSTALRLMAGEEKAREGRVRVRGGDPTRPKNRIHLLHLPEVAAPPEHLTASETLTLHLHLWDRPAPRDRVRELLERVGLLEVAGRRVGTFSKGMRRRLELACVLGVDADLWLLDEPQAGLDPSGLRLLRELCLEARDRGRALVIASHALGDVPALADRVVVLERGRTRFDGTREELIARLDARGYVLRGGDAAADEALAQTAVAHGGQLSGPDVPPAVLEDLLFEIAERQGPAGEEPSAREGGR